MKIYITDNAPIGKRCKEWVKKNLLKETELIENIDDCDIFFSIFYDKIISMEFIANRKKCFNFHGGILPDYRGSGTINWAIINGEKETGVTLHEIDSQIDHGPIIDTIKITINDNDTAQSLYEKLEDVIFQMFKDWFNRLITLNYSAVPQDHSKAKLYTRKDLQKAIDVSKLARAFIFYDKEKAFYINKKGEKIYLDY